MGSVGVHFRLKKYEKGQAGRMRNTVVLGVASCGILYLC